MLGLVKWDYDVFMGGVFFDTLSVELLPLFGWLYTGSSSIIFFVLAALFYIYLFIFCHFVKPAVAISHIRDPREIACIENSEEFNLDGQDVQD